MIFRWPSLGWAKAKLPARAKPASAELQIASLHLRATEMRAIPPTLKVSLSFGRSRAHDHADASHPLGLLRARRERPRSRRSTEQRYELASPHVGHQAS